MAACAVLYLFKKGVFLKQTESLITQTVLDIISLLELKLGNTPSISTTVPIGSPLNSSN